MSVCFRVGLVICPVQSVSLPVARDDGKGSSTHDQRLGKWMKVNLLQAYIVYFYTYAYVQVHLNKLECRGKVNLFQ